jgi:PAS domain-containing protein
MQQNPNKADGIERLLAPSGLDFEAILRAAPDLYLILSPELIILDASDAYLRATLITREIACGHHIFEIFPDPEPSATGVSNLRSSLERVLKNKVVDIMPIQKYDIKIQQDKDAPFEERYWSPINSPVIGEDGKVKYIIHRVQDVTRFMRLAEDNVGTVNQELISRNLQTALELYLREQELSAAHERLYESEERFSLIINSTKDYAIYMLDPEGFILTWNEGAQNIKDYKPEEIIGKHFSVLYPAEDRKAGLPARNLKIAKEAGRYEEEG